MRTCRLSGLCLVSTLVLAVFTTMSIAGKPFTHRLVNGNIGMQNKVIDSCLGRMRAAASLGYNGYITTNWEDNILESQGAAYLNNVKRVVAEAKKVNIALIPRHFHQSDISYDNFNLAEAFPVRGTRFKVTNGEARAIGDHETGFTNGDFEMSTNGKPDAWKLINLPGAVVQKTGAKTGTACLRLSGGKPFARIQQKVTLRPFRAYRLSAWVSTRGFTDYQAAKFRVIISDKEFMLDKYRPFGTPRDHYHKDGIWTTLSSLQGWKLCQTDFNSLDHEYAFVEFVVAHPTRAQIGTLWLDDIRLEEVGLYETVRSRTRPIIVRSADGSKTYTEGTDYVVDPKCNTFTDKSFWYQGHLQIPGESAIQEGQELRVSWYQMNDVLYTFPETNFCLSETREAARDNIRRMDEIYEHSNSMYLGYDEWRTAFWDDRCELFPKAKTAGEYMAGTLRMTLDLLWSANPCREVYVISDMYDPYFNAYWPYYAITNGGCQNSWKDMDTNVIILNWNACGKPWDEMSVRLFMGLDDSLNPEGKVYRQVLNVLDAGRVGTWLNDVEKAEKEGGRGVVGILYVDWEANFNQMAAVKNACVARGRWGTGPMPPARCVDPIGIASHTGSPRVPRSFSVSSTPNGIGIVKYHLEQNSNVEIRVTDIHGRTVGKLVNGKRKMGSHQAMWDASTLSVGVYFLTLSADGAKQQALKHMVF